MAPAASLAFLGTQMEFMWYPFVELTPSAGSSEFRTWGQRGSTSGGSGKQHPEKSKKHARQKR